MKIFKTRRTITKLDDMLTKAINGTFSEEDYNETELLRLESKWKQYFTTSRLSMERTKQERENLKATISDISHQMKTPLSNILLYTELLQEETKKAEEAPDKMSNIGAYTGQNDRMSNIGACAEQIDKMSNIRALAGQIELYSRKLEFLTNALVKMSRLESGMLEIKPKKQAVYPLVLSVCEEANQKAERKAISLELPEDTGKAAFYDMKWTQEAVYNILDNAVKYSPSGSRIALDITAYTMFVCISVKDEGIGISEDDRAKIFTRFYRNEQVQQEEGVGIGLYLAREILHQEGGYIKVESKEGAGSTFKIYLPA